jgi:hypothetical protein
VVRVTRRRRTFDALPAEELFGDALRDDLLEVGDALGLDDLALGLGLLPLQHPRHPLRLLLGPQLLLDGCTPDKKKEHENEKRTKNEEKIRKHERLGQTTKNTGRVP